MSEERAPYNGEQPKDAVATALAEYPIPYRPSWRRAIGSVSACILWQQILFRATPINFRPFYKFRAPCEHRLYKPGDSWTEELCFSGKEFDTALDQIATKITTGMDKATELEKIDTAHLVLYWTDANRVTWYQVSPKAFAEWKRIVYLNPQSEITSYLPKGELAGNSPNGNYMNHRLPETTTEMTPLSKTDNGIYLATPKDATLDPLYLPEVQPQIDMLIPKAAREDEQHTMTLQAIERSTWRIAGEARDAAVEFIIATGLPMPMFGDERKDWKNTLAQHAAVYGVTRLKSLYPAAVRRLRDAKFTVARPGSLTKTITAIAAEEAQQPEKKKHPGFEWIESVKF